MQEYVGTIAGAVAGAVSGYVVANSVAYALLLSDLRRQRDPVGHTMARLLEKSLDEMPWTRRILPGVSLALKHYQK